MNLTISYPITQLVLAIFLQRITSQNHTTMQILCDVKDWLLKYSIRVKRLKQRLLTMIIACCRGSGKLQTGLTCHHKFNSDMMHSTTTGIQKNIGDLLENLDKAMDKYNATYSIGSTSKSSVSRKKKENRKKSEHRKKTASEHRKRRACIIFQSLGGSPIDWEYNPEIFGILQIDNIDQETSLLFTSHTNKSCLRDLLSCKCFVGEAEVLVQNQLGI